MREKVLKIYDEVAAANPNFDRKGKTMPYTSVNGHMFSLLNKKGELGIRLSKEDTTEFDEEYGAKPFISYGATMRNYVLIPETLLKDKEALTKYLQKGYEYAMSLPPK
ncbi:MAG: TfoX/Sxy family protein [Flavobacteriaceae bacterium]